MTNSTFAVSETMMFAQMTHCSVVATLAMLLSVTLSGCMRSYHTEELKSSDLVGSWEVFEQNGKPQQAADKEDADLILHANGKFEAKHLPWTNSRDEIEYVNETGEWELIDKKNDGLRSRWKLSMRLSKHQEEVPWDVFVSGKQHPYLGLIYDLDTNAAVLFEKAAK